MSKSIRIEKGIRQTGNTFQIGIELPSKAGKNGHTWSFHVATVYDLSEARNARNRAYRLREECIANGLTKEEMYTQFEALKEEFYRVNLSEKIIHTKLQNIEKCLLENANLLLNEDEKTTLKQIIKNKWHSQMTLKTQRDKLLKWLIVWVVVLITHHKRGLITLLI